MKRATKAPAKREKIKGVFATSKRLSDGSIRTYWYHRSSDNRLPGDYGSPEFLTAYLEAERLASPDTNNVANLIRDYLLSVQFSKKATRTQAEYKRMLKELESRFGTLPIKALESGKVKGLFLDYQEEIGSNRPREADNRLSVMSAVFTRAVLRGVIKDNPLRGFERIYSSDRSDMIWLEGDIRRFMNGAPVELQRALILAVHTGQRKGDLIRLRWSNYDGDAISLTQSKTSARVTVKCTGTGTGTGTLKRMLDDTPRQGPFILTRADGMPWFTPADESPLSDAWRNRMDAAGFYPKAWDDLTKEEKKGFLHFNDLRGTAVTLLAEAKCSVPMIASITGHTLQSATRILEKYLARTATLSEAAILMFENASATAFANQLQTETPSPIGSVKKAKLNQEDEWWTQSDSNARPSDS
jgi:integrase